MYCVSFEINSHLISLFFLVFFSLLPKKYVFFSRLSFYHVGKKWEKSPTLFWESKLRKDLTFLPCRFVYMSFWGFSSFFRQKLWVSANIYKGGKQNKILTPNKTSKQTCFAKKIWNREGTFKLEIDGWSF